VEQYPELKANANFIRLQDELAGTENRIAVERMPNEQSCMLIIRWAGFFKRLRGKHGTTKPFLLLWPITHPKPFLKCIKPG